MSWWRDAVVYAVDVRSFCDSDGDGVGDLDGVRSRLGYLELLDVDAISIGPPAVCGPGSTGALLSPDDPDPAEPDPLTRLIDRARGTGLRVLAGLAPGHVTTDHEWFRAAARSRPGSAERERLHVRPGRGTLPPTGWRSLGGDGPAWSRLDDGAGGGIGTSGVDDTGDAADPEWYLHLTGPGHPDLNWADPEVWAETEKAVRAWCDRGVDGLWIDGAPTLCPRPDLSTDPRPDERGPLADPDDPRVDGRGVHEVHRTIRAVLDHYPGRIAMAGPELADPARAAAYGRPDELHLSVAQGLRGCRFDADRIRDVVDRTLAAARDAGAAPAWTSCGPHDARAAARLGDVHRARAIALVLLALPGAVVLDAGDELCLPDPSPPTPGGPRSPLNWADAADQLENADSALSLHRRAIELRRRHPGFTAFAGADRLEWFGAPEGCLAFRRAGSTLVCALNTSPVPVPLPPGDVLLSSRPLADGDLPADSAAWLT